MDKCFTDWRKKKVVEYNYIALYFLPLDWVTMGTRTKVIGAWKLRPISFSIYDDWSRRNVENLNLS